MTIEQDTLRADFRALKHAPLLGLPEYSADPIVVRRVGKVLAVVSVREANRKKFRPRKHVSFLDDDNYWRARFDVH